MNGLDSYLNDNAAYVAYCGGDEPYSDEELADAAHRAAYSRYLDEVDAALDARDGLLALGTECPF